MTSFKTFLLSAVMSGALIAPAVAMAQEPAAPPPPAEKAAPKGETRAAQAFAEADANKDGALDVEEFLARHREKFKEIDTSGDGKITADEMKVHGDKMREKMKEHAGKHGKGKPPVPEQPAE